MNHGAISTNTTYNVIMVFDVNEGPDGTIKSNVNGGDFIALESVGSQNSHGASIGIGGINQNTVDPRNVGSFPGNGANFDGWIGEIWQWNHALTEQEISDLETYQALKWTDRPSLELNEGATVLEGASVTIGNTLLNALDNDTAATALTYQLTSQSNGNVQLSGSSLSLGSTFTQDDIDNNRITFLHDDTDTADASFDFRLTDGGTLVIDTFELDVTPVDDVGDDAPIIATNLEGFVQAGGMANITQSLLEVSDVDTASSSVIFTIDALVDGTLFNTNTSTTLNVSSTFTQADINAGFIRFDHDGTISIPASFDFSVTDGTTTVSDTFVLDVDIIDTAANDPPVISNNTGDDISTSAEVFIFAENLQAVDPDDAIDDIDFVITAMNGGTVFRSGVALSVSDSFTQAEINFGIISFVHDGTTTGTINFEFNLTDGNTTVTGLSYDFNFVGNTAPVLAAAGPFSIAENAANLDSIVTMSGFDADGDGLTYSIQSGNGDGIFQINPINGEITIADNSNLDFESTSSYNLVIRLTDDGAGSLFDEQTVVINITDINEAPVLPATAALNVGEFSGNGDAVGTVTASDPEGDTLDYRIDGGTGAALFNIDNSGNITVNGDGNFDFESGTTSYTIDVAANDGTDNSNTQTITINITDDNDAPVLPSSGPFSIGENAADTDAVGTVNGPPGRYTHLCDLWRNRRSPL